MKYLVLLAVIVIGGYFYPQIAESKGGPCQAFEAKLTGDIHDQDSGAGFLAGIASGISDGQLGRKIATREYPDIPESLACVRAYYTLDSSNI